MSCYKDHLSYSSFIFGPQAQKKSCQNQTEFVYSDLSMISRGGSCPSVCPAPKFHSEVCINMLELCKYTNTFIQSKYTKSNLLIRWKLGLFSGHFLENMNFSVVYIYI